MTYQEQLKHPLWKAKRREIIEKAKHYCVECGLNKEELANRDEYLTVHHVKYVRGRMLWEYPDEMLRCLCNTCHFDRQVNDEEAMYEFARILAQMSTWEVYSLSKGIRQELDGHEWKPKQFDAWQAMKMIGREQKCPF